MQKSNRKHKDKHRARPEWSDWVWSPDYQQCYRTRQRSDGQNEYDWYPGTSVSQPGATAPVVPYQTIPRSNADLDGVAKQLASQRITDDRGNERHAAAMASGNPQYSTSSSTHTIGQGSSREKGKERAYQSYQEVQAQHAQPHANAASSGYSITAQDRYPAVEASSARYRDDELNDPAYRAAIRESMSYGRGSTAGSSSSRKTYATYGQPYEEDERSKTPTGNAVGMSTIFEKAEGQYDTLDPQPRGTTADAASVSNKIPVTSQDYSYVGFRRCIIVKSHQGHSICVPIATYQGKGCNKRGLKPETHGMVYSSSHRPRLLDGEPKLGFDPVRIRMYSEEEKLAKQSRINYSKYMTVEHNVKVLVLGDVYSQDYDRFCEAADDCWNSTNRPRQRRK